MAKRKKQAGSKKPRRKSEIAIPLGKPRKPDAVFELLGVKKRARVPSSPPKKPHAKQCKPRDIHERALANFDHDGIPIVYSNLKATTRGRAQIPYMQHTFMVSMRRKNLEEGSFSIQDLPRLLGPIIRANRHLGGKHGRIRSCYKNQTIIRARLVEVDEDGNMLKRFWKNIAAARRWDIAMRHSDYSTMEFLAEMVLRPNYNVDIVQGVQVETRCP